MDDPKTFFDTTVLLSMYGGDADKRTHAKELFRRHARSRTLVFSTLVVEEFYAAASGRLHMPRRELVEAAHALMEFPLVAIGPAHIHSAILLQHRYTLSFWDALTLTAAESAGVRLLYSEQMNDGEEYGTVTVRNPFNG